MRRLAAGLFAGVLILGGVATPAFADTAAVALVVGLKTPDGHITKKTDFLDSAPLGGSALTVEVPADQVTDAAATLRADPAVKYVELDHVAHASAVTPDDPAFDTQWGLKKTGVTDAWASARGAGVTVAVVDTGVTALPDFAGRLLPGYDFVNDDNDPADDNGHGTMSAGVIAAAGDNGIGVAGICWLCKILPVKVLGSDGSGSYSAIAAGIRYAADQDADIINLSLGGASDSQLLRDAVAYAVGKGSMVIAAAGNEGSSVPHFPAAIPSVLAVGGSTAGDARYPWSNYGSAWVDLAAPGCNPAQGTSGVVNLFCGTSSATPFASGVAALLASTTPTPSPATIRNALMSTAVPLAGNWVASGRIDAAAALASLPFWVTGVRSGAYVGNSVTVTPHVSSSAITRVTASLDGAPVAVVTSSPWTLTIDTSGVTGPATITVTAYAGSSEAGVASFPIVADHAAPTVAFTQPAAGALVRGTVRVTATATDDVAVARVQLLVNHKIVATDTIAPYSFSWPSSAARLLELRAFDRAGNAVVVDRAVTVDNTPPTVVVTKAPANGARNVRGTQHLAVSAADAHGIARLELAVNGKITQTYAGRRHTFAVATSHYGSVMTVQVRAYDRAGNVRFAPARKWYR